MGAGSTGAANGRSKRLGFRELQKKGRELVREGGPIRIDTERSKLHEMPVFAASAATQVAA